MRVFLESLESAWDVFNEKFHPIFHNSWGFIRQQSVKISIVSSYWHFTSIKEENTLSSTESQLFEYED